MVFFYHVCFTCLIACFAVWIICFNRRQKQTQHGWIKPYPRNIHISCVAMTNPLCKGRRTVCEHVGWSPAVVHVCILRMSFLLRACWQLVQHCEVEVLCTSEWRKSLHVRNWSHVDHFETNLYLFNMRCISWTISLCSLWWKLYPLQSVLSQSASAAKTKLCSTKYDTISYG